MASLAGRIEDRTWSSSKAESYPKSPGFTYKREVI
jgi:hypothetical protein